MIIGERYVSKQRDQCYSEVGRGEVTLQYIFTTTNTENAYTYGKCLLVITTVCKSVGMQRSTEQDSSSPIDQCCFLAHAQLDAQLRSHPSEWVTHQRDLPPCHLPTTANQGLLGDQMLTCLEIQHHTGPEFPKVEKRCGRFSDFPLTVRYAYPYSVGSRVGFLISMICVWPGNSLHLQAISITTPNLHLFRFSRILLFRTQPHALK